MNVVLFVCGYHFFGLEQEQWTSLIRITFRVILIFLILSRRMEGAGYLSCGGAAAGSTLVVWWPRSNPGLKKFLRYLFVGVKIKRHRLGHDRPIFACNHVRSILATSQPRPPFERKTLLLH